MDRTDRIKATEQLHKRAHRHFASGKQARMAYIQGEQDTAVKDSAAELTTLDAAKQETDQLTVVQYAKPNQHADDKRTQSDESATFLDRTSLRVTIRGDRARMPAATTRHNTSG